MGLTLSHNLAFRYFRKEKKIIRDWRKRGIIHNKPLKEIALKGHKNDPERKNPIWATKVIPLVI